MSAYDDYDSPSPRMQPATNYALALIGFCLAVAFIGVVVALAHRPDDGPARAMETSRRSPATKSRYAHVDATVDAQALFTSYMTPGSGADLAFTGKILEVSGNVGSIGHDAKGVYLIFAVVRLIRLDL